MSKRALIIGTRGGGKTVLAELISKDASFISSSSLLSSAKVPKMASFQEEGISISVVDCPGQNGTEGLSERTIVNQAFIYGPFDVILYVVPIGRIPNETFNAMERTATQFGPKFTSCSTLVFTKCDEFSITDDQRKAQWLAEQHSNVKFGRMLSLVGSRVILVSNPKHSADSTIEPIFESFREESRMSLLEIILHSSSTRITSHDVHLAQTTYDRIQQELQMEEQRRANLVEQQARDSQLIRQFASRRFGPDLPYHGHLAWIGGNDEFDCRLQEGESFRSVSVFLVSTHLNCGSDYYLQGWSIVINKVDGSTRTQNIGCMRNDDPYRRYNFDSSGKGKEFSQTFNKKIVGIKFSLTARSYICAVAFKKEGEGFGPWMGEVLSPELCLDVPSGEIIGFHGKIAYWKAKDGRGSQPWPFARMWRMGVVAREGGSNIVTAHQEPPWPQRECIIM